MPSNDSSGLNIVFVADVVDGEKSGGVISARRLTDYLKTRHKLTIISTGKEEDHKIVLPQFYLPFAKKQMIDMGFLFAWPNKQVLIDSFKDADLVHIQFPFLLGYQALKQAKKMGKPVVLGFHLQPENLIWNVGIRSEWLTSLLYHFFVKTFYNKGDIIISPSEMGKTMLEKYGITVPVKVISNGLPVQFKPENHSPDPKYTNKFIILMVGRMAKEKRHNLVIEAIKRSKYADQIQLIATGKGPLLEELKVLGNDLPNPAEFTYVSQKELIRLFNTANLFIHASEIELEGMAVMEAIGCGLPALIANAKHSASTQFALNEKFLFTSGDAENLSAKIDYWIDHEKELKDSRPRYLEKAKQYSFAACVQQTEDLYLQIVNQ
jgi:glycosyltransferase involved in cell wall biosynthesis